MTFGTSSLTLAALDQVAALRSTEFQGDDSAVMRLLHQYGADSDLANLLWDDLSLDVRTFHGLALPLLNGSPSAAGNDQSGADAGFPAANTQNFDYY